jgi:polysaccharide export outer membrane protein
VKRTLGHLVTAASLAAFLAPAAHATSKVTKLGWDTAAGSGDRRLVVDVDPPITGIEVVASDRGIEVRLPDTTREAALPTGLQESRRDGRLELVWPLSRGSLRSVSATASRVTVTVSQEGPAAAPSYRIGVGDVLYVAVYKNQDLTSEYTVSPEGTIKLPLVGDLPAAGWTENNLAARLTEILAKDYLVDPQVSVTVRTYQSQFIYVTGAVSTSRRVSLRPGLTMKGVLAEAGIALAPGQAIVLKPAGSAGKPVTLDEDDLDDENAPLPRDGDVVTVQERPSVLIQGEVRRAGRFPLEPGMTLLEALAVAEGTTEWAQRSDVRIRRKDGEPNEINANLKRIEDRKDPDPVLRPGDMIIVRRRAL